MIKALGILLDVMVVGIIWDKSKKNSKEFEKFWKFAFFAEGSIEFSFFVWNISLVVQIQLQKSFQLYKNLF